MLKRFTSRERVEIALEHKEPDRVPCDLTISPDAYAALCNYLDCKYEPYWWDDCNHAFPSIEVLEKLNVDIYHIPAVNFVPKDFSMDKTEFKDQWGNTKRKVKDSDGSFMYIIVDSPLKDAETVDDILSYPWPRPEDIVNFDGLEEMVRHVYKETDLAITATFGGHVFEQPHFLRGFENFLVDLCINEEVACALMDKVLEINLAMDKLVFEAIGKYLTYIRFNGEDIGTQNAPLISQEIFTKLVKPRQQKEWRFAKSEFVKYNPLGKICVHSCGAVFDFIPHFIEMGIDILNPIQPNAFGMDTKVIKQRFGDKLSFHGGIDTQNVLSKGSRQDVISEVKTRLNHLAKGGGYLAAPSHNVQYGMPMENIVTMYETIHEYGTYPICIE